MKVWFNVFFPLIYLFHPFIPHSVFKLGSLSNLFILTLLMSKPPILQSFIRISSVGVFLFPSDLITDMVIHTSVTILLGLIALHLLLSFSLSGYFVCYPCSVPAAAFFHKVKAPLPWQCIALAGGTLTHGGSCPAGLPACFTSPARPGVPSPGAVGPVGNRPGWHRCPCPRSWTLARLPPATCLRPSFRGPAAGGNGKETEISSKANSQISCLIWRKVISWLRHVSIK